MIARIFLFLLLAVSAVAAPPVGGGFLSAGLRGTYYNAAGEVAFTRKDPRIDFQWGAQVAPGGSRGRGFNALGTDNFRVVWNGRLRARFSETYTFTAIADDNATLRIRPSGGAWTEVLAGAGTQTGPLALSNITEYEVELEYREITGEATMRLFWESPSVPREIIEPIFEASINWVTYEEVTFADAIMNGRGNWEGVALDENGWPIGDGDFIVSEINAPHAPSPMEVGNMQLTFNGGADVTVFGNGFIAPGSLIYDVNNNRTTATVVGQNFGANVLNLRFRNTSRTGHPGGPGGVTNVRLMRPNTQAGDLIHPAARAAFADRLTAIRFQRVNDQAREWSERTPPRWPYQGAGTARPFVYNSRYGANYEGRSRSAHEFEIMLCNETGCDYFVTVPHLASNDYIRNLALLIRNGSDENGVPYAAPTANPFYPPLNPNLRVYVEVSNELWNFLDRGTYSPYHDYRELIEDMADANTADFQILNFDNLPMTLQPDGYYVNNYTWVRRYWALKLVQIGNAFRGVFGEDPRIRTYFGYQYANANQTAEIPFQFLNNYFNNVSGNFVASPRPANYYIFAAGGAGYYGSGNPSGRTEGLIPNNSFEMDAGWQFSGSAGMAANVRRANAVLPNTMGTLRNNYSGYVGMSFTVGSEPVWVYELGRFTHAGNTRSHPLILVRNSTGELVTYAREVSGGVPGGYNYSRCVPVLLEANTSYSVLTREEAGYDLFGDSNTTVLPNPALSINGAVTANPIGENTYAITMVASGSFSFGPMSILSAPASARGNPDAYHGLRVAYVSNENGQNGVLQQTFQVPRAGVYGLAFRAVQRAQRLASDADEMHLRITVNGVDITYRGINGQPQPYSPFFPWQRVSYWIGDYFFTETFDVQPGEQVTLRIEGVPQGAGSHMCFIDDLQLTSVDALFEAGIPDTGEATGQPTGGDYIRGLRMDARWAQSFGMHHMTYEHGWSIGGDSGASPIQEHAKYRDPRAAQTMIDAIDIFHRAGGANFTLGTYSTWPLFAETIREEGTLSPTTWPLAQGLDQAWSALPAFADNGVPAPATLTAGNRAIGFGSSENRVDGGEWISWNIVVPQRGDYQIRAQFSGGGNIRLTLNETDAIHAGPAPAELATSRNLSPGLHTLKLLATSGTALFANGISVTLQNAPGSPTLTARDGDGQVYLTWTAVAGAESYVVRYGPEAGFPSQTVEAGGATQLRITELQNGVAYYFTVSARSGGALSLPSNEVGITPFGDNELATLAAWDFAGQRGDVVSAPATVASSRVSATPLARGAGFAPADWAPSDCFLGTAVNWAQTLPAAVGAQHFVEFTLTPNNGRAVSIHSINFRPAFQNLVGGANDPRGVGLAWRVGNAPLTAPVAVSGVRSPSFNNAALFEYTLGTIPELQRVTSPVTFRIYFHGMGPYEAGALGGAGNDIAVVGSLATPPLLLWRETNGLDPAGADDDATPANDGIPNVVKYAFNISPLGEPPAQRLLFPPNPSGLPNVFKQADAVSFMFVRRRAETNPGISYEPVRSEDLVNWQPLGFPTGGSQLDDTWELVVFTYALGTAPQYFAVRVRVE